MVFKDPMDVRVPATRVHQGLPDVVVINHTMRL